jgi:hypothetical protein
VNVQRRIHLRQRQGACLSIPAKRAARIGGCLASMLLVEDRILGTPLKEAAERFVQVTQRLLQWYARHLVQPRGFRLLFETGERRRHLVIPNALLAFVVRIRSQAQRPVIDETRTPERPRKQVGLFGRRVEPIAVRTFLLHAYNHIIGIVSRQ